MNEYFLVKVKHIIPDELEDKAAVYRCVVNRELNGDCFIYMYDSMLSFREQTPIIINGVTRDLRRIEESLIASPYRIEYVLNGPVPFIRVWIDE